MNNRNDISLTKYTSIQPPQITKTYKLDKTGKLIKKPGGAMTLGTAELCSFPDITAVAKAIAELTASQAFGYGVAKFEKALVVTKRDFEATKKKVESNAVITRTGEFIKYWPDRSIIMIDVDTIPGKTPLTIDEVREILYKIFPALRTAPHLIVSSASTYIYNKDVCLKGPGGIRILVAVANGGDIPRAGEAMFERSWLNGKGYIAFSKSGAMLKRSIIDPSVYQPERLDFIGPTACEPPLEQRRPEAQVFNPEAEPLDTTTAIPSLTLKEAGEYQKLQSDAKTKARPEAKRIEDTWIDRVVKERLDKVPKKRRKEAEPKIRETYTAAARDMVLQPDFLLYPEKGKPITIKKLLANPDKYHNARFADPLEPDYGNDKRIAQVNLKAAKPYIWSFAHGGIRYSIRTTRSEIILRDGRRAAIVDQTIQFFADIGSHYRRGCEIVTVSNKPQIFTRNHEGILLDLDKQIIALKEIIAKNGDVSFKRKDWNAKYAKGIIASTESLDTLPELLGIATAPILDPNTGRLIDADGFDEQTGLLLVLNDMSMWPGIPDEPTIQDLEAAVIILWKAFGDFPFDGPVSRGVWLNALLTTCVRPLLPFAPGYCVDAPTAGSGKTLLAKCACKIADDMPGLMSDSGDNNEMRKALLSLLRENRRVTVLDNVVGIFDSPAVCAMLTTEDFADRLLGVSQILTLPTRTLFMLTGNNVTLKGDICRRILTCRIDTETLEPWKRSFELDPVMHCRDNRLPMIAAALTIIRAGMQSGPSMPDRTASFELWSDTTRRAVCHVRDVVEYLDVSDPVEAIDGAYKSDPETQKLSALCAAWWAKFEDIPKKVSEVIKMGNTYSELTAPLDEIAGEQGKVNARRLGRWIEKNRGKIVTFENDENEKKTVRFLNAGQSGGTIKWALKAI